MLTEDNRVLGHKLAGQWLEQRGETDALVLAEHFEKAGEGEKAAACYLRAADAACNGGDSEMELGYGSSFRPFGKAWLEADRGALEEARGVAESLVETGRSLGRAR